MKKTKSTTNQKIGDSSIEQYFNTNNSELRNKFDLLMAEMIDCLVTDGQIDPLNLAKNLIEEARINHFGSTVADVSEYEKSLFICGTVFSRLFDPQTLEQIKFKAHIKSVFNDLDSL